MEEQEKIKLDDLLSTYSEQWKTESICEGQDTIYRLNCEGHKITVLDRLTGWGGGIRDIETGYKNPEGKFWLASGNFDIREFKELTINDAIKKIKEFANTCIEA